MAAMGVASRLGPCIVIRLLTTVPRPVSKWPSQWTWRPRRRSSRRCTVASGTRTERWRRRHCTAPAQQTYTYTHNFTLQVPHHAEQVERLNVADALRYVHAVHRRCVHRAIHEREGADEWQLAASRYLVYPLHRRNHTRAPTTSPWTMTDTSRHGTPLHSTTRHRTTNTRMLGPTT